MPHFFSTRAALEAWEGEGAPVSERAVLDLIDEFFPQRSRQLPLGRGHDCAVLAAMPHPVALSTDVFVENVHFSRRYFMPAEVGAKALASAVSDLAAAGAVPMAFSLGLILPPGMAPQALRAMLSGMAVQASALHMELSGGDLSRGDALGLSVTVWGRPCDDESPFLQRVRARPGHCLFLVGSVGLSRVGLRMLERDGREALDAWPEACRAHLHVQPLLAEGQALARLAHEEERAARKLGRQGPSFSLMDVSDGLAADVPRLLGPLGADLTFPPELMKEEVKRAAPLLGASPEEIMLLGGEDYALAGTCPARLWPLVMGRAPAAVLLGTVREQPGLSLGGKELAVEGFDHFSGRAALPAAHPLPGPARSGASALARAGREAWEAGLMAGFNGNISCRLTLDDGRDVCLITRSGAAKARLDTADVCLLDIADGSLLAGPAPSTESAVHLGIYRACPESRAVLHVHPPKLLAASLRFDAHWLALPLPEAETYRAKLGYTPFFQPGSAALGKAVASAAKTHAAVWMERHGLVTHGPDLGYALSLAEELEQLAAVRLDAEPAA